MRADEMNIFKLQIWLIVVACVLFSIAGCRNTPRMQRTVDQMGQQRRETEDKFYALQYEYEKLADTARELQDENELLKHRLGQFSDEQGLQEGDLDNAPELKDVSPDASGVVPKPILPNEDGEVIVGGDPVIQGIAFRPITQSIISLSINRLRTTGRDFDGELGDDGFVVVLEPRDSQGDLVLMPGPIEVRAYVENTSTNVAAHWKLNSAEVQRAIRSSSTSRGIPIELRWPGIMPRQSEVTLVVRMRTRSGDDVTAQVVVPVYRGPQISWSPER